MADTIDLSKFKSKDHPSHGKGEHIHEKSEPKRKVKTAFLVVLGDDGTWEADLNVGAANLLDVQDAPDGNDLVAGLSVVLSDVQAQKAANMTAVMMQQMAMAQMQQMQNQQLQAQIQQGLRL